ncbi:Scr1 family TA system antitoxin-like transcriptional regulator [Streptomyces sp. NPDC002809]|uniref:Scr1 family TA system antitoxin-like transcriptional regulator n=1 Tax=Streptomyces sp. NPDC002809 TaxID=3154433 RepID=UPI003319B16E
MPPTPAPNTGGRHRVGERNSHHTVFVPGLLQTDGYARALFRVERAPDLPEEIDAKVNARLERAQSLERRRVPQYWVILPVPLLWTPILQPQPMAAS